jgi:regulator of protease activity HflC (stomatin/prohibitin superfamily)
VLLGVSALLLLVMVINLQSVYWVLRWRRQRVLSTSPVALPDVHAAAIATSRWQRSLQFIGRTPSTLHRQLSTRTSAQSRAALGMGVLSLFILFAVYKLWQLPITVDGLSSSRLLAIAGVTIAFGLLVLERYFAGRTLLELPEAPLITPPLRVTITVLLLASVCLLADDATRPWLAKVARGLLILPLLLAIEYGLRALLSAFTPANPDVEPEMLADSLLAGLWRWPLRPLHNLHNELQQRFGIDLRQNWAFGYVRRALLPVIAAMVGVAWLLSGITEIPIAERGIYERFGKPVTVWTPGLHAGLPWPFARVRRVEFGVIHELATASAAADDNQPEVPIVLTSADGLAPSTANRLWDASHVAEKSQVIASRAGDKQSFHVVNMDVRFIYRIGLNDAAALAATYNSSDVQALIRSTANRVLVRDFASRTLDGVLGEARSQLAIDVGTQVQADLNTLQSGVEILATVIEAIHPPAAAANAYHSVQAAQISAQAIIARERGKAAEQVNTAQLRAVIASSQADAAGRETVATAEAAQLRFAAERDAFATAGKAFLFEQYLAQLTQGLANAQLVIIDHRLRSAAPTIDLRPFGAPLDANVRKGGQ